MPKATLNIEDFSGGIVKNKNPRDLEANECQESEGFTSINPGLLSVQSNFSTAPGFIGNEGGYEQEYLSQGIYNTWAIQPEYSFRRFLVVKFISSAGGFTTVEGVGLSNFTATNGSGLETINHGLTTGIRVTKVGPITSAQNISCRIEKVSDTQFKVKDSFDITNDAAKDYALLAIEATYDASGIIGPEFSPAETSPANNIYIIKSHNLGMFGFYNLGTYGAGFYGELDRNNHPGCFHDDPWLFDIEHLWDWRQTGKAHATTSSQYALTPAIDAYYDSGHFRVLIKPGDKWFYGHCRRPVSFIHFNNKINLYNDTSLNLSGYASSQIVDKGAHRISEGWYPLRSHILSPVEYKVESDGSDDPEYDADFGNVNEAFTNSSTAPVNSGSYTNRDAAAGFLRTEPTAVTSTDFFGGARDDKRYMPVYPHRFAVAIGTGDSSNQIPGDWQFKTGDHKKIALGISYIYDDIEFTRQLESTINPLEAGYHQTGGSGQWTFGVNSSSAQLENWVYADGVDGDDNVVADNTALNLSIVLNRGTPNSLPLEEPQIDDCGLIPDVGTGFGLIGSWAVGEWRGKSLNSGYSNRLMYNPRIVGVNIWFTGDNTGMFDDPYWLATFDFEHNKKAVSHDGVEGDGWNREDNATNSSAGSLVGQTIAHIKTIPNITYKVKNGYDHKTVTQAWYTTSAIVNRRLYAGNVSYFDFPIQKIREIDDDYKITHKPDRILVSPVNKFDILPVTNFLDIVTEDGQDIVKLVGFGQKLLVFKHDDLFVVDASGEFEFLEKTHKGLGVLNPVAVTQTPEYIFWLNERGVYAFSREGELLDIVKDTLGLQDWRKRYCNGAHISFDPEEQQLLIHCAFPNGIQKANNVLLLNIANGSIFTKPDPCEHSIDYFSNGLVVNNKLYITGTVLGQGHEDFDYYQNDTYSVGYRPEGWAQFKLASADSAGQAGRPGDSLHYLLIRNNSGWVCINTEEITTRGTVWQNKLKASEATVAQFNKKFSVNPDINVTTSYDPDTDYFTIKWKALKKANTFNATAEDLSGGNGSNFGTSTLAFSTTNNTDGSGIHHGNITDFSNVGNVVGGSSFSDATYYFMPRRNSESDKGVAYNIKIQIRSKEGKISGQNIYLNSTYITGEYAKYEKNRVGTGFSYGDDCTATDATNAEALTKNIREFLESNPMIDQYGKKVFLDEYFEIGAATSTGVNTYFTLKPLAVSMDNVYQELDIEVDSSSNSSGNIYTWSNNSSLSLTKAKWVSKDYDFGQPNVRKKVYRGYITYKGEANCKISINTC